MAGRPKTQAKRLAEIEERVYAVYMDLEKLRPKQYAARQYEDEETQDELCLCWNIAVEETKETWGYLEELLVLLEQRAGLPSLYLQRRKLRGLLKEERGAVEGGMVDAKKDAN
jgi:hypothetical protein